MIAPMIFFGSFIPTFFAGEVKRPEKNLLLGGLASLVVMGVSFIGASYLLSRLVPTEWLAAESFLAHNAAFDGNASPSIVLYAMAFKPFSPLIPAVGIAWIVSLLTLAQAFIFYASRIVLAWAEDDLIPASMGYVHTTMGSPLLALLAVAIAAIIGLLLTTLQSSVVAQINFILFVVVAQLLPVLAITLFPFLQKDWYRSSSRLVRLQIGPVPVITLVGFITLIYLIGLIAANAIYPNLSWVNQYTLILFAVLFGSGLLWYFVRKSLANRSESESQLAAAE
jgi:amino acid transporter